MLTTPPEGNREWITRLLDAGVWNLHATRRWANGTYGDGPHTEFRTQPPAEHLATANARAHVTAMLESADAFRRLDEIAAVPGIDALTIGPTDLAQDLGAPGTPSQHQALNEHRSGLIEIARKHGKAVAMAVDTIELVREVIAQGATIVNYSSDVGILRTGYAAAVTELRNPKERPCRSRRSTASPAS